MNELADVMDCRHCLCQASRTAARRITAVYDRRLRPHGLRVTQFTILTNLMLRGEIPITVLAKAMGVDRTTLTRNVALLQDNGWVRTEGDSSDNRIRSLSITPKGKALVFRALPDWKKAQASVSAAFGAEGVSALHRLAGTAVE